MIRELVFNSTGGALALSSHLHQACPGQYKFRPLSLDPKTLADDWRKRSVVLCLSIQSIGDARLLEHVVQRIRDSGVKASGWPKLVVGGPVFNVVNCENFLEELPEVSYIVKDHGEQALRDILQNPPEQRIVSGHSFGPRLHDTLAPVLPWHPERPIPICRGDDVCQWGRCRFCHHSNPKEHARLPLNDFCKLIAHYCRAHGWRHFYIYDNHLHPDDLIGILHYMTAEKLQPVFHVFGMRLVKDALKLTPHLKRTKMVASIGWGLEVYSQRILNLYRKGIQEKNIEPILAAVHEGGVDSSAYILIGLPGMRDEDYWKTSEFCEKHLRPGGLINDVIVNWFLLNPFILDRMDHPEIQIRQKNHFRVNQYFGNDDELAGVKTCFVDFDSHDAAAGKWLSREESFLQHSKPLSRFLAHPSVRYDHRAFFLDQPVWEQLWGDRFPAWQRAHQAPIARPMAACEAH